MRGPLKLEELSDWMWATKAWIKKMWCIYIYAMECYSASHAKNEINAICSNMKGPRDYHSK